jgi:O-antigen/teichoic acid export membrane protein
LTGLFIGVFTNAILAQSLGVSAFGQFGVGLTILTVITQLSDFGAVQAMTAEARRKPWTSGSVAGSGICIRLVTAFAGVLIAVPVSLYAIPNSDAIVIVIMALCAPLGASGVLIALSNAKLRPEVGSALTLAQSALWLIGVVAVASDAQPTALKYAIAFSITTVAQTAITLAFFGGKSMIGRPTWGIVRLILGTSWPVGLLGLLVTSYYRVGGIVVIGLAGAHEAGLYTAAYKIIDVAQIVPSLIVVPILPLLIDALTKGEGRLRELSRSVIRLSLLVALGAGLCIAIFSGPIVKIIYGSSFSEAAQVLEMLGVAFVGITMGYVGSTICFATNRVKRQIPFVAALGAVSLGLQPWAIGEWGALGSAYVSAATEIAMCTVSLILSSQPLGLRLGSILGWRFPLFMALLVGAYFATRQDLIPSLMSCGFVFCAGSVLLRLLGKDELELLLRRKI